MTKVHIMFQVASSRHNVELNLLLLVSVMKKTIHTVPRKARKSRLFFFFLEFSNRPGLSDNIQAITTSDW